MIDEEPFDAKKAAESLRCIRMGLVPVEFCSTSSTYPEYPHTLEEWAVANPDFAQDYANAKLIGADAMVHNTIRVSKDMLIKADTKKVQIEAIMRIAALWNPDKYGPKADPSASRGLHAMLHVPFDQLSADKKSEVEKFFGLAQ